VRKAPGQTVKILTADTVDGLDALELAAAEALAPGVTSADGSWRFKNRSCYAYAVAQRCKRA
jgi:hypothetical protein